jgi:hypothetical protein
MYSMSSLPVKKERWTLIIDRRVKHSIIDEARRRKVRPSRLLEDLIKEKFNPFGHTDVVDPTVYVRTLRRKSRMTTDKEFLTDLKQWEKVTS